MNGDVGIPIVLVEVLEAEMFDLSFFKRLLLLLAPDGSESRSLVLVLVKEFLSFVDGVFPCGKSSVDISMRSSLFGRNWL